MSAETLAGVLGVLDHFRANPGMYTGRLSVDATQTFLHGLRIGCELAGLTHFRDQYARASQARGWRYDDGVGVVPDMRRVGCDTGDIFDELIAIERAAYQLAFEEMTRPDAAAE